MHPMQISKTQGPGFANLAVSPWIKWATYNLFIFLRKSFELVFVTVADGTRMFDAKVGLDAHGKCQMEVKTLLAICVSPSQGW